MTTASATPSAPIQIHTSSPAGARLQAASGPGFVPTGQAPESELAVFVQPARRYQTLLGFGGAVTDATAEVFARLSPAQQDELLRAYYDPVQGIGYRLLRTTVHSCDFSSASYTYVAEGDATLASFDLAPDRRHRLPMIRRALAVARAGGTQPLVYVSPWSAPGWMKDNGDMLNGGRLLPQHRDTWARYLCRTLTALEAEGVPVWGLTVQNEPMARQRWESMLYTAEEERDFVRDFLGPALQRAGLGDRKLMVWDHNRDLLPQRMHVLMADPAAARFVWGAGFHWYETWAGGAPMHANVAAVHAAYPQLSLLGTEACVEGFDPARLNDWANAQRYARQILEDLNAGAVGWTDWNLLLDARGGPNHVGNFCFAPVHLVDGQLVFTPSFHALGHFAKFLRPGAQRVSCSTSRSTLRATAVADANGGLAVVVMNESDAPQRYRLQLPRQEVPLEIPAGGLQTLRIASAAS